MPGCIFCGRLGVPGIFHPPHPCQISCGGPCTGCVEMKELEDQISAAKEVLERMLARHRELRTKINHLHDPFVHRMPPEIVSTIFHFCLSDPWRPNIYVDLPKTQIRAPLILGAVCRTWRQIAWTTPQLWTHIHIVVKAEEPNLSTCHELARQWLIRAGQLPLSIYLSVGVPAEGLPDLYYCPLISLINRYSGRWLNLDLRCPAGFLSRLCGDSGGVSILQKLRIDPHDYPDIPGNFSMSHVKHRPTSVFIRHLRFTSIDIEWTNVTCVEATALCVDECLELLRRAPRLVRCKFDNVISPSQYFTMLDDPIVNASLKYLDFTGYHEDVDIFFNHLTLPALENFICRMNEGPLPSDILASLFRRSSCPLKELLIFNTTFSEEQVIHVLWETPYLRNLELPPITTAFKPDSLFHLLARTLIVSKDSDDSDAQGPFLPALEEFRYISIDVIFPWRLVPGLFGPLSELDNPNRRPFHKMYVFYDVDAFEDRQASIGYIEKEDLLHFLELQEAGMTLMFGIGDEDRDFLSESMEHHCIPQQEESSSSNSSICG